MTLQNKIYQQRINEVLGAGGGFGQQEPNFFQTAPKPSSGRPDWSFPSPRGPANQTRGLYSGGGFTYFEGLPVTEAWQELWDKWINNGGVGDSPMPPQFQGMFENNDAFDFDGNDPQSGWHYYNSIFNWLFGNNPMNWGDGALQQMIQAGIIDVANMPAMYWQFIFGILSGGGPYNPIFGIVFIQVLFGDTGNPAYANALEQFQSWMHGGTGLTLLLWLWQQLYSINNQLGGQFGINQPF